MNKWDIRFLTLAELVSTWSKDPVTKVGAVIVDQDKRIVSVGYNGFPRYVNDSEDKYIDRDKKLLRVIHAEMNAILFSSLPLEECTLYSTLKPCSHCTAHAIQAGIHEIVYPYLNNYGNTWRESWFEADSLCNESGVISRYVSIEDFEDSSEVQLNLK